MQDKHSRLIETVMIVQRTNAELCTPASAHLFRSVVETLVDEVLAAETADEALDILEGLIAEETQLMRDGESREALAATAREIGDVVTDLFSDDPRAAAIIEAIGKHV